MFSRPSGMTGISIGRFVEISPYLIINGKDKLFLLNMVQLVQGRDPLVVGERILVYIGHRGWIRLRDHKLVNEVLDVMFETKEFFCRMDVFLVVMVMKVEVPSLGNRVWHGCRVKRFEMASLEEMFVNFGK